MIFESMVVATRRHADIDVKFIWNENPRRRRRITLNANIDPKILASTWVEKRMLLSQSQVAGNVERKTCSNRFPFGRSR
jgi:hypothetical protein